MRMSESARTTALILTALLLAAPAGAAPGRIVSLTPVGTEILFALGLGDSIAAVTEFCDTPEEARLKPKIGGFAAFGLESLLAMETDLVVMQDIHAQFAPQFEQLGIPYAMLRQSTLAEVLASIEELTASATQRRRHRRLSESCAEISRCRALDETDDRRGGADMRVARAVGAAHIAFYGGTRHLLTSCWSWRAGSTPFRRGDPRILCSPPRGWRR